MSTITIGWSPLLPWLALGLLGVAAVAILSLGAWRRAPGIFWRCCAVTGLFAALANPSVIVEEREPVGDIGVIIVDQTPSTRIGERDQEIRAALSALEAQLADHPELEMRIVTVGANAATPGGDPDSYDGSPDLRQRDGTHLFGALEAAVADIPRRRFAGAIMITDGQVHDAPTAGFEDRFDLGPPLHALIAGDRGRGDRFLEIVQAPSYGIVGQGISLRFRVEDPVPGGRRRAVVSVRRGVDEEIASMPVTVGQEVEIEVTLDHGGANIFSLEVDPGDQELTLSNNNAVVVVNGVRDRLRVLLVSGQPHAGERTWRNLLKSDPAVDLVHFTILRPPNKQDSTPVSELSLIAFPVRELFEIRLNDFDLIIFDNYQRRGVLPQYYLNNIADYVEAGGALLEATGSSAATETTLASSPIARVLPAIPTGTVLEQGFRALITDEGARHPVTSGLTGGPATPGGEPEWGRWFRQIEADPRSGTVVMDGIAGRPLLLLDRVGEGRVAQFTSDQIWLWARGFEGGGPHGELLRRLAHWLMKEPELEEDVLIAEERGGTLDIVRRSLTQETAPVEVTFPSGRTASVDLTPGSDGTDRGNLAIDEAGIYRLEDGRRTALAAVGSLNPLEFSDVTATQARVEAAVETTGGGIVWLAEDGVPVLRRVDPDRRQWGRAVAGTGNWIGLQANRDYLVSGVTQISLWPALFLLAFGLMTLLFAWRREGQ